MTDPSLPAIPTPPSITKDTTLPPVRGYVDYNPTPQFIKNPAWTGPAEPDANGQYAYTRVTEDVEYARRLGFTPAFMVYDATMNYAPTWGSATPAPGLNRMNLDWSKTNPGGINDPASVAAVANLAMRPRTFGANLPPYRPIFLDIEDDANPAKNPPAVVQQIRQVIGNDAEFYWYDDPSVPGQSGVCLNFYNWNIPAEAPDQWFAAVDAATAKYPGPNKVAVIQPRYKYDWGKAPLDPKSPQPDQYLSLDTWKRQVRYLVSRSWSLFLWGMGPLAQSRAHIEYAAKFIV